MDNSEKQPLLSGITIRRDIIVNGDYQDDDSSPTTNSSSENTSSLQFSSLRVPSYGTDSTGIAKIIPLEDRITYSWSDINAFTSTMVRKRRKYICCGESSFPDASISKHILKNVTGIVYPGEVLAVLGSSGAGKTTLLNTLTFRNSHGLTVTGTRSINGVPVDPSSLTSVSAYVQQHDLFIGSLTVREHLIFQALVRMDRHISKKQRMQRIEEVLVDLSLKKCEHSFIGIAGTNGGISGGERKRLSFAAEVLTNPCLMFCDEPTSGLDSFMALNVVQVLKKMAQSGKTVVCTIHQPSSELFSLFDKLLLMAEGRTAFLGTPEEAHLFFAELEAPCPKNYNPADYFIQLLAIVPGREESCKQAVEMICNKFERSDVGVKMTVEARTMRNIDPSNETNVWMTSDLIRSPYKASWCAQLSAVLWRSWLSIIKDQHLVKVRFLQTTMVAILIGIIYYGQELNKDGVMNINGVLYLFLINMTFQNVYAVIYVFTSEMPLFLRENKNGMYRTDVYFLSKIIAETPIFIIIPIIFTSVAYFMIGLNPEIYRFLMACSVVTLVSNVATSFGYMISCLSSSTSMALSLGPPLIIPFLLFGGFFLNINSIPVYFQWLSYFSWFRYGNEALMINQWEDVTYIDCQNNNSTCPANGHIVLMTFNFVESNFHWDLILLAGLIFFFRLIAYLGLLYKSYQ